MSEPETHGLDVDGFLAELARLSETYSIYIGGCGCCASPYLEAVDGTEVGDGLVWNPNTGEYRINP